ncbi:MAG: Gfo/Idh/MocA family oxidoreductase [Planctomycetes bacterium]|nr:Gfo/Idh/MocA family oxidoreductase [Planctomycetota bacterium]
MTESPMTMRAAVVGCGALAHATHLPNLAASDRLRLQVACDLDPAQAEAAARRFGAARHESDWRAVVAAPDVDLIVLCTHTNLRADLIVPALAAGKPVYTEKPVAAGEEEMLRIIRAARSTGVPVCVGHNRRSAPAMRDLRRLVALARTQGADVPALVDRNSGLREPLREESAAQILIRVNDDSRTWKGWIFDDPHGIMLSEMVHFIDLALLLAGSDPVEVYAYGSNRGNFTLVIGFRDGSCATLQHTLVGNFDAPKELVEVAAGHVTVALDHFVELRQRGLAGEPFRTSYPLETGAQPGDPPGIEGFHRAVDRLQAERAAGRQGACRFAFPSKGHRQHLEAFAAHLRGEGPNPCPVDGAYAVTRIALKLLQSARTGQPQRVLPEDYDLVRGDHQSLHRHCL